MGIYISWEFFFRRFLYDHALSAPSPVPLICSHYRSVQYFRFALNPRNRFIGYSCPAPGVGGLLGLLGMWRRDCPVAPAEDRFGIYTQRRGGRFDLKTTSMPPYCVGCS